MTTSAGYVKPASGTPCAAPMTRAALLAIRTANALVTDCFYEITDWVQGTKLVGPNIIQIHAVDASTLNTAVDVKTPFDNVTWPGVYDIDNVSNASGTMTHLSDTRGNVVQDNDGSTVGAFPWGSVSYSNNYVQDATLTSWPNGVMAADAVRNNNIVGATVNFAGMLGGSIFTDNTVQGGNINVAGGANNKGFTRNTFKNATFNVTLGGASVTDSEFVTSTVNFNGTNVPTIVRSEISNSTITRTNSGLVNSFNIIDSEVTSTTYSWNGSGGFVNSIVINSTIINGAGVRSLSIYDTIIRDSTINDSRTNNANGDEIHDSHIVESTVNLTGASDGGAGFQTLYRGIEMSAGSTFSCNGPSNSSAASALQVFGLRITAQSQAILQGNACRVYNCRLDTGSVVTFPNFLHTGTIIELQGATVLTASNINRLRNKGFSDVV